MKDKIKNQNNRIIYLDVLRVLALFFIMIIHVVSGNGNWDNTNVNSYEWRMLNIFDSISRWGVPVFIMISGALFLNRDIPIKKLYSKYIFRLAIAFIVWSAGYAIVFNIIGKKEDFSGFVIAFLKGAYHMWFIYTIIGLYMITPFLRQIVTNDKLTRYFILLALVFLYSYSRSNKYHKVVFQ